MILKIFDYVNLTDLIKNCVLVSKKWYGLVDEKRNDELIINFSRLSTNYWYSTHRPINLKNLIFCNTPDFIGSPSFVHNFNLKYLKIHLNFEHFDVEQLHRLTELEHLEIDNYLNLYKNSTICLKKLRVLHLNLLGCQLQIDAEKLEIVCCNELIKIDLKHKESVRQIEVLLFDASVHNLPNLEILKLTDLDVIRDRQTIRTFLSRLPKTLAQLHFYDLHANGNARGWQNFFELVRETNPKFRICLNDIRYSVWLEEKLLANSDLTRLVIKKLDQFDAPLPWFKEFDYNKLLHICRIGPNFFGKFNNLQVIRAGRIERQNAFTAFLKSCHNLSVLFLTFPTLSSGFYSQLPVSNRLLTRFTLFEEDHVVLNYRFVLEFKLLVEFSTTHHLSMRLTADALKSLNLIERFHHINQRSKVTVFKLGDRYCVEHGVVNLFDLQLDQVVAYCAKQD